MEATDLDSTQKVARRLPIGSKYKQSELDGLAVEGGAAEPKAPDQPPAPIIYFQVLTGGDLSIMWDAEVQAADEIRVTLPDGTPQTIQPALATLHLQG